MNILIANVGNVRSNELKTLALALNRKHRVTVACMAIDSSNKGQAFSYCGTPVRVNQLVFHEGKTKAKRIMGYEFYSTPADAVSIMLGEIMKHNRPDIVICGINNGIHMGQDIYYSSNVGMAMESVYFGVPSIAVGIARRPGGHSAKECAVAVKFVTKNIEKLAKLELPKHTFLNINIPTVDKYEDLKGVEITRLGWVNLINEFEKKTDHKGDDYYWAKNVQRKSQSPEGTSIYAYEQGFVSITPIDYNATSHEELKRYEKLPASLFKG